MRKFLVGLVFFSVLQGFAQDPLGIWKDHIPHGTIFDIAKIDNRVFCATEIGLFLYDDSDQSVTTYSKLNGLSDIGIQALAFDEKRNQLIIGYKNGNIDVFDGENIRNVNDIVRSPKYVGKKRVNHIKIHEDLAYISTGFGIIELDLNNFLVLNTIILGNNAEEIEVFDVDIDPVKQEIYAATQTGLRKADMNQPLIFFSFWSDVTEVPSGTYTQVEYLEQKIFANKLGVEKDDSVFYTDGQNWLPFPRQPLGRVTDLRANENTLTLVDQFLSISYLSDFTEIMKISDAFYEPGTYKPRVAISEKSGFLMFIGNTTYGLIRTENTSQNKRIQPDGPFSNSVYALSSANGISYVAPGSIDEIWNRLYQFDGIFVYQDFEWRHISSDFIDNPGDIVAVTQDPVNPNKIWANAWGRGIVEITNDVKDTLWNHISTNGALTGATGSGEDDIRTGGLTFDENGNLWATNSLTETPLVKWDRRTKQWSNYGFGSLSSGTIAFKDILINDLNQVWMQTRLTGFVVAQLNNDGTIGQSRGFRAAVGRGNLPEDQVLSMAEDLDGEMWLGTLAGLVVCYAPQNIFNGGNFDAQPVLFEEDGVVQKLLGTEQVTAIAVDGANKKWFGTQNAGVFYTSEDGTETIYHFTKENSPLLSNGILDITVDNESGEVFFGTAEGVVSFRNAATTGNDDFTDVYAYPNPVRPEHNGPIFIRGLATNAQVKITDVQGNLVFETVAEGGQAIWYGTNFSGDRVSSGVYLANMINDDGSLRSVTKILIIN